MKNSFFLIEILIVGRPASLNMMEPSIFSRWINLVVTRNETVNKTLNNALNNTVNRIVCYYTNWAVYRPDPWKYTVENINPNLCTHLIYAFGNLNQENSIKPFDKYQDIERDGYVNFNKLKSQNQNLKTLLAIGGANDNGEKFSLISGNPKRRMELVDNVIKELKKYQFDGVNLDWQNPSVGDEGMPEDKDNYAQLVQDLREGFDRESQFTENPRLILTLTLPTKFTAIDRGFDVPKLNKYVDWMVILSYNYHNTSESTVSHHSLLHSLENSAETDVDLNVDATVQYYLKKGASRDKLVLGIPAYGRSYTLANPDENEIGDSAVGPGLMTGITRDVGFFAYYEICDNIKNKRWKFERSDDRSAGPYAYQDNQWVGYDDEESVKKKADYVVEMGLGGIAFWALDLDDFQGVCQGRQYPLIETGKNALINYFNKPLTNDFSKTTILRSTTTISPENDPLVTTSEFVVTTSNLKLLIVKDTLKSKKDEDFTCKEEGFFSHPHDCDKYFWCRGSMEEALKFVCSTGLYFNVKTNSCDFSHNVLCNGKIGEMTVITESTTLPFTLSVMRKKLLKTPAPMKKQSTHIAEIITPKNLKNMGREMIDDNNFEPDTKSKITKDLIELIKKYGGTDKFETFLLSLRNSPTKLKTELTTPVTVVEDNTSLARNNNNIYYVFIYRTNSVHFK